MVDPVETNPIQADETSRMQAEAEQEMRDAKTKGTERELARQLLKELELKKMAAQEVIAESKDKGSIKEKRQEAKEVKRSVIRVLAAVKEGIIAPPPRAKTILIELANQGMTDSSASYLQRIVDKYVNNDIVFSEVGQDKSDFEKDFGILKSENPIAAQALADSLRKAVQKGQLADLTEDIINENFHVDESPVGATRNEAPQGATAQEIGEAVRQAFRSDNNSEEGTDSNFNGDWRNIFNQFYSVQDQEVLKALYSTKEFKVLLKKREEEIRVHHEHEHPGETLSKKELMIHVSEKIEADIVLLYSKLFTRVDKERPSEFFQEIIQKGFMQSIQTASDTFNRRVDLLGSSLDSSGDPELEEYRFARRYSKELLATKSVETGEIGPNGEKLTQLLPQYRVFPLARITGDLKFKDFFDAVRQEMGHEFETRAYLHNVRAMYLKGPGKDGFWPQLAHYAEEMKTTDIDGIMNLPDSDLFMTAYRLYQKYVEEAFVQNNWIHPPNMFSSDLGAINTKIEQNVLHSLKEMYGDKFGNVNFTGDNEKNWSGDEWRLKRAMTMAVGLARGLLLTEAETAAYADPNINQENGGSTFLSYYTNDNTALNGLNPQHQLLRFLTESSTQGPLIFMLASGFDAKTLQGWDHTELWKKMNEFKDSFMKGTRALNRDNPRERTLMEILPNISNVGSLVTRDSWRTYAAYEGWIQYQGVETGQVSKEIDFLKTWKSVENIGYEVLLEFVNNRLTEDFLLGKGDQKGKREELLQYVFNKYIRPGGDGDASSGIEHLLNTYRPEVEKEINTLIKKGQILPEHKEDFITKELYKRVFYRGLVGVIAQRMPTKFLRMERNRTSETGVRIWERIRSSLNFSTDELDAAMHDILVVETRIRQHTSKKMRDHVGPNNSLHDLEINDYLVDEATIRRFIKGKTPQETEERVQKALLLYGEISKSCLSNEDFLYKFSRKIRDRDASGMFINRDFPFSLGSEELDFSFLAYRNIGDRGLARAIGDIGAAETDVFGGLQKIMQSLHPIAVGEKHDFMPLVETIEKIQKTLEGRIDKGWSVKLAGQLAGMVIAYYKKDTRARNLWTKLFSYNRKNSLAAEFAGNWTNVWEWDVGDIDKFMFELGRRRIIPNEPYDLNKGPGESRVPVNIPFTNIRLFDKKVKRAPDYEYYTGKVRKDFGASKLNKAWEIVNTVVPLFLIFLLYKFLNEAFKELEGSKK